MNVIELREKAQRIAHEAKALLTEMNGADQARASELETQFDRAIAESDALYTRADKLEANEAREAKLNAADPRRPVEDRSVDRPADQAEVRAKAFNSYLRGGDDNLSREERSALREMRAQSVGTNSSGGYTVPKETASEIIDAAKWFGPMMDASVVTHLVTGDGRDLSFPTGDDTANVGALIAENTAATALDFAFGSITLNAYKYTTRLIQVPNELFQDTTVDITAYISKKMAERVGRIANTHLTVGDGSSKPNGIATAASVGVTSASPTAIVFDELMDLMHSVDPAYRNGAAFMLNDATLKAVRKMKDTTNQYLWQPSNQAGVPATLLGAPVYVNNDLATIGATAVVGVYGQLKGYTVRRVRDLVIVRLNERYAEADQVGFVGFARMDGDLLDVNSVKSLKMHA